jgi:hypothetical protein
MKGDLQDRQPVCLFVQTLRQQRALQVSVVRGNAELGITHFPCSNKWFNLIAVLLIVLYYHALLERCECNEGIQSSSCVFVSLSASLCASWRIWTRFGVVATGVRPKIVLFISLQSIIPTWRTKEIVRWNRHSRLLPVGPYSDVSCSFWQIQNIGTVITCIT